MSVPVLSAQHQWVLRQTELATFLKQAMMKSKQDSSERIAGNFELLLRAFQSHSIGKQAMMKSKPGSGKRQDCNFEIVVNHITINEDQLPQVSRHSMATLKDVFGHNIEVLRHSSPQARH